MGATVGIADDIALILVAAFVGGESVTANPGPEFTLVSGDVVSVLGNPEQRAALSSLARS
jgi:K+/H+ antiporter YhaU regulatory subunit KhtT